MEHASFPYGARLYIEQSIALHPAVGADPIATPPSEATGVFRAATDVAAAPQRGANPSFATEEPGEVVCPNNGQKGSLWRADTGVCPYMPKQLISE